MIEAEYQYLTPAEKLNIANNVAGEFAVQVSELSDQVADLSSQIVVARILLWNLLDALSKFDCLDKEAIEPCGTCWPCASRAALQPIPLH